MKKTLKLISLSLIILLAIVGCSNNTPDDEDVENPIEENQNEDIIDNTDSEAEDPNSVENEEDNSVSESPSSTDDILSLGDTGLMETAIGKIEVTPTSIRFLENVGDERPFDEIFLVMELTITNVGDEAVLSEEMITARLHGEDGSGGVASFDDFSEIDNFEGELEPGETVSGEVIFDFSIEDKYQLSFGAAYLGSLSNEVRWEFDADEAE